MKQILNVAILYDNENEVLNYANLLSKQTAVDQIVLVIVINKLGNILIDEFESKLHTIPIKAYVFNPDSNLGYLNGALYGYAKYCSLNKSIPQWVVISNTDIEFRNNTFFADFINAKYEADVWCVGPSVYSAKKKSFDNPEYVERCSSEKINKLIYIHERPFLAYLYARLAKIKGRFFRKTKHNSKYIYSAKGCFFFIKDDLASILVNRKFKALLYSEESYIAEIIREYNKRTYYDNSIEVVHTENAVTGKLFRSKREKYIADSLKVIRDEFYINNKN